MDMTPAGVRTRAQAALAMEAATSAGKAPKRRKITDEPLVLSASSFVQLKPETTLLSAAETTDEEEERCHSPISDEFPASCCSSNGSVGEGRINFVDLEVESVQVEMSTCNRSDDNDERREQMSHNRISSPLHPFAPPMQKQPRFSRLRRPPLSSPAPSISATIHPETWHARRRTRSHGGRI